MAEVKVAERRRGERRKNVMAAKSRMGMERRLGDRREDASRIVWKSERLTP